MAPEPPFTPVRHALGIHAERYIGSWAGQPGLADYLGEHYDRVTKFVAAVNAEKAGTVTFGTNVVTIEDVRAKKLPANADPDVVAFLQAWKPYDPEQPVRLQMAAYLEVKRPWYEIYLELALAQLTADAADFARFDRKSQRTRGNCG